MSPPAALRPFPLVRFPITSFLESGRSRNLCSDWELTISQSLPSKSQRSNSQGQQSQGKRQCKIQGIKDIEGPQARRTPQPCLSQVLKCSEAIGSHAGMLCSAVVTHTLSGPQHPTWLRPMGAEPDGVPGVPFITLLRLLSMSAYTKV